ncbi:hypothetical protein EON63_18115 [archaeon]|nr:MAG: hypothetical protein EON63_18115 [archaeon]
MCSCMYKYYEWTLTHTDSTHAHTHIHSHMHTHLLIEPLSPYPYLHLGIHKVLSTLLRHKLLAHALQEYDGYRLSYMGYDILALHALQSREIVASIGKYLCLAYGVWCMA